MLHSLLDRRQSGHDTYVYRSFEETTREILRLRLSTTRTCSQLRVTVIGLFFPLPVSIQFENAPVPRRRRNVSIDSTGSIRSSWRAKDRKLFHSRLPPLAFLVVRFLSRAIVSNKRSPEMFIRALRITCDSSFFSDTSKRLCNRF